MFVQEVVSQYFENQIGDRKERMGILKNKNKSENRLM